MLTGLIAVPPDPSKPQNVPPKVKVRWIASPFFNDRPVGIAVDTIVLHHTTLATLQEVIDRFHDPKFKVSSHYIIDRDGQIVQMVALDKRAYHAGVSSDSFGRKNVNDFSVGIELVNTGVGAEPYPEKQIKSLLRLISMLKATFPLKVIVSHEYVADPVGRKDDPFAFPWGKLKKTGLQLVYGKKAVPRSVPKSSPKKPSIPKNG